ncbi:MAG: barstar family protein [Planctomycetia bacterium]|nr:barstar family protein [Planctomycetia bacterium]
MTDEATDQVKPEAKTGFEFLEKPSTYRDAEALVVHVPVAARGKQKVLGALAKGLRFPSYFGWNWDALDECLRDLSWLGEVRRISIVHDGLPFSPRADLFYLYRDLLAEAAAAQSSSAEPRTLKIIFPAASQPLFEA